MRTCAAGAAYARLLAITFIPLEFDGVELGCGALRPNGNEARMHCAGSESNEPKQSGTLAALQKRFNAAWNRTRQPVAL